jgi:hypothetical protein
MFKFIPAFGIILYIWFHPVHVAILNVDLDPKTGKIEIAFKLYSDDIESVILNRYKADLNITHGADPGAHTEAIHRYIGEFLEITVNGTKIDEWDYTGNESDEESTWLYYTKLWPGQIKEISIKNEVLMDLYEDQTNLVIISWSEKQNGYRLNNKNREISFILE